MGVLNKYLNTSKATKCATHRKQNALHTRNALHTSLRLRAQISDRIGESGKDSHTICTDRSLIARVARDRRLSDVRKTGVSRIARSGLRPDGRRLRPYAEDKRKSRLTRFETRSRRLRFITHTQVSASKETRVGVSKGNLDDDLRHGRRASACIRLWVLRMPTLP